MGTFRLYTGADGQSHVETIDLAKTADWTAGLATTSISFRGGRPRRLADRLPVFSVVLPVSRKVRSIPL